MRRVTNADALGAMVPMVDVKWQANHPLLYEHLTSEKWEDGAARETSTLTIYLDSGLWKVCLNNRAEKLTAWLTAETWGKMLDGLEKGLADGTLDWRIPPWLRKKR